LGNIPVSLKFGGGLSFVQIIPANSLPMAIETATALGQRSEQSFNGSARCPLRMAGEQSVHEADFVNEEKAERHTD
jgi:hypothetical protein